MTGPQDSKTFCVLPWIHSYIATDGVAGLCCFAPEALTTPDGRGLNIQRDTLAEMFHSPAMEDARRAMLAGHPVKACANCYKAEAVSGSSWRTQYNHYWTNKRPELLARIDRQQEKAAYDKPLHADIHFGNLCNLRCQICNPHNSSQVERDPVLSKWAHAHYLRLEGSRFRGEWYETPEFLAELTDFTSDLQLIALAGGEPSMSKPAHRWLASLIDSGQAPKIEIRISTNLTNVNTDFLDLAAQFGKPMLFLSVDGFGPLNDYLRYPSHWRIIERNALHLKALKEQNPNLSVNIAPVVSAYNALSIVHLFEWAVGLGFEITPAAVRHVDAIDCALIPGPARQLAVQRIRAFLAEHGHKFYTPNVEDLCTYLEAPVDPDYAAACLAKFHAFTREVDADRGMSFERYAPEMAAYLGYAAP
jgi:sulfatase maturation enzyme AslB (radical SAM superfamily)